MTLPTGAISMNDVNVELGKSGTSVISLNDADVRTLASLPSGAISMNDLRGKSAGTLTASKTGGATAGSSVSVYLQIASIAAYPLSRTFNITYSLNSAAYTSASLVTTTITVAANATSSSNTLVYSNASAGTTCTSLVFQADSTGHTTKTSNTLSGGYV